MGKERFREMRARLQRILDSLERGRRFVTHDVWHIGAPGETVPHGLIIKQVRVTILLVQNLTRDALTVRAAALTFATIFGAVPFLALMFFVFKTFSLDTAIYEYLSERMSVVMPQTVENAPDAAPGQTPPESHRTDLKKGLTSLFFRDGGKMDTAAASDPLDNPVEKIVDYAQGDASKQVVGIAGLLFVLGAVFSLMNNIESAFNTIWGIRRTRSWYRMFSDYLTLMVVLPFAVALVITVTAVLESEHLRTQLGLFGPAVRSGQYALIWMTFTAMYFFIPNTRVRFRYALLGGVVGGTLWCLLSWGYVKFQVEMVPRYSMFFSGVAQVPILLIWVYLSWLILLFGAELTFAYQHEKTFAMERLAQDASYAYREALGLWVMLQLARRFDAGLPPGSVVALAEEGNVPARLVTDTLEILGRAGLAAPCDREAGTYQVARSLNRIAAGDILAALRESGRDPSALRNDEALQPILRKLFDERGERTSETLAELLNRVE